MRILKIANINNSRNSGMGRVMHSTADELRGLGHTVDLCFSADVPRLMGGRGDRFIFPVALVNAVKHFSQQHGRYDIVEIHEPSAAWYCYLRRRDKTLPPCVVMSHGSEENYWQHRLAFDRILGHKTSLKSRMLVSMTLLPQVRYSLRHSQQVMCLNSLDERFFRENTGVPEAKISRIQHGVEKHFFLRKEVNENRLPRLLFVGTWLENKGSCVIPEAYRQLVRLHPGLHLSLLGTGFPVETVLSSFHPDVRSSIIVSPRVDDAQLRAAYADHDILLLPSFFESWGLVLLEAAAAGLAIVSGKGGGPLDVFEDHENALLISAIASSELINAVDSLVEDSRLRKCLADKAQERARQFTWFAAAQSHLRAYERAIKVAATE